ncbi:MAG: hypothetical protein NZ551_06310 [Microscillaceae bacterium]|nr:hypothetical protein [Microscillaceae bacterium]MDW8460807.1 hypothetical protein [Cytophagales bacterium]
MPLTFRFMSFFTKFFKIFFLGIVLAPFACTAEISIPEFDSKSWINDKNGCKGDRQKQIFILQRYKDKLLKASQNQILALLGKPDAVNLGDRTQKFYIYYYANAKVCPQKKKSEVSYLQLRFSAIDLLVEIVFKEN